MPKKASLLETIALRGLEIAPSQVWGAIRIVPLLRRQVRYDLRLWQRQYRDDAAIVSLKGDLKYMSYVPHGLVLSWSDDGSPLAAFGGQLVASEGKLLATGWHSARLLHRMAKRERGNNLRFLPLHLAMEGFLSMFFSGPDIAWSEYSRQVLSRGLSPRWEMSVGGRAIDGLEDALRVFEIHEQQVGVLLFVADALASAFVTPTSEDYRALHRSLLEDFYGELLYQYGCLYQTTAPMSLSVDESKIDSLADLQQAIAQMRSDWAAFQGFMASNLLGCQLTAQRVYTAGPFSLQRFITDLHLKDENHIGEAIVRDNGELEYLKTYRLSAAQTRRVYLLSQLAACGWQLDRAAERLGNTREDFVLRLEKAGFGYLLNNQLLEKARKYQRQSHSR
ncbi:MAG: hypothetical protein KME17_15340 [Cyanosarcina radialis HA8281-LM2]|jgi:hypothetical protein|nr:hypothetical protein [Cyanosarcina radialis HA8281-LM2]